MLFLSKFYLNTTMFVHIHIVYGCFYTMTEVHSCHRACKAQILTNWPFTEKNLHFPETELQKSFTIFTVSLQKVRHTIFRKNAILCSQLMERTTNIISLIKCFSHQLNILISISRQGLYILSYIILSLGGMVTMKALQTNSSTL